jgi:hypothetical protein
MSRNLHPVIRSASQMTQASDSAPGPTKRQELEQAQALWARHDRMRGNRARASLFYRDRTGLEHHGDGGRSLMRACSTGDGAATAVSAGTVEADRDGLSFRQSRRKVRDRSGSARHVSSGSLLVCDLGDRSANAVSRHEAMRSVRPIVSSSRCVGRLGISDKENDRLSMTLVDYREQEQQMSRLSACCVRPRVRQIRMN